MSALRKWEDRIIARKMGTRRLSLCKPNSEHLGGFSELMEYLCQLRLPSLSNVVLSLTVNYPSVVVQQPCIL